MSTASLVHKSTVQQGQGDIKSEDASFSKQRALLGQNHSLFCMNRMLKLRWHQAEVMLGAAGQQIICVVDRGPHFTSTVNVAAAMKRPSRLSAAPWFVSPPVSMDARCTPRLLLTFRSVFTPQLRTTPTLALSTHALAALSAAPPPCSASICALLSTE